jgi:hypothetical protein
MMSCGVLALGVVAATDVPAALTHPQMDPLHPLGKALLTPGHLGWWVEALDRVDMRAGRSRESTLALP